MTRRKLWMTAAALAACMSVVNVSAVSYGAVRTPIASGSTTYGNSKVTVDASHTGDGYVMIKYTGSNQKIKIQITKGTTYTYNLNARSTYEVFPLTDGNGTYSIKVFENVSGTQYTQALSQDISVSLSNPNAPYLYPNQYVNFNQNSAVVGVSNQIAGAGGSQIDVVTNIFNYVVDNFSYDTAKATSVQSGYLPNVDATLASKTGICFDYASVMTAMLRAQDIPTKLVIGYAGQVYHAWISVYLENQGWVDNVIYFDGVNWSLMDPTFASSGGRQQGAGNASYQTKYTY